MSKGEALLAETRAVTLVQMSGAALEAYVKSASEVTGLPIVEDYLNGVVEHFAVAARMADRVLSFPLPDEAASAPVFEP